MTPHIVRLASTNHKFQCAAVVNVVLKQRTPVQQLLAGKEQLLHLQLDVKLVFNLRLDVVDAFTCFDI